ncbi:Protoporphyrinogen oxidase [Lachnospiraceae bacterium]|nr:Protoporphyrinogen oxidase [Lachnospiraceae bacterium]
MKKVKYLILGAGPSGLTFANMLLDKGIEDFAVLEKEDRAGGLCRTEYVNGQPVDFGGGHILDTRSRKVDEYMFRFLPESEWNHFTRDSQIYFKGQLMGSPFEAHIWQLPTEEQVKYLKAIAVAGCNLGTEKPEKFVDWITWKLGSKIAEDYMLPYNRKMFSKDLNSLGTYWLAKLPDVSFDDTLMSCLEHRFYGKQPCHSNFLYPKNEGFGDCFVRMAERLGDRYFGNTAVDTVDFDTMTVNHEFQAEKIIVAMPWTEFKNVSGMPADVQDAMSRLKHSEVQIDYYAKSLPFETTAQWIYYPSEEFSYHRIMAMENFALGSKGYWTETNGERVSLKKEESDFSYLNHYAYPLNTLEKPEIMEKLLSWGRENSVYGLGRWGEWSHFNADVCMERAMDLADELTK